MINRFVIKKLHGNKDFDITFDAPYKILLSENGCGKTTILNILYAVLNKDISKLQKIEFESIALTFSKPKKTIQITKAQLQYKWESRAYQYIKDRLPEESFKELINLVIKGESRKVITDFIDSKGFKVNVLAIRELIEEKDGLKEIIIQTKFFTDASKALNSTTLYLPTYRRVEENLDELGISKKDIKDSLINFGLDDVVNQIDFIRNQILQLSNESFNSVSGDLLTKMINGSRVDKRDKKLINGQGDLVKLILSRVGKTLSEEDQQKIINLVSSQQVLDDEYDSLAYFLARLIEAYQKQKDLDESLKKFANICNEYFRNKRVEYDESKINVNIYEGNNPVPIDYNQLSSGEKQIASLFAKLYLYGDQKLAILFDEPELSLSVEWQERLLKDIVDSGKCIFLLAMTHSPFIFKNMAENTSDISMYFSHTN